MLTYLQQLVVHCYSQVQLLVKVYGVIVAERRRAHYLVIITVDPYIYTLLHYCAWVDIHSDPNAGMHMDNKSTTSLKFQGSKSLLPPLNL